MSDDIETIIRAGLDEKTSMVTITPEDPTDKAFMRVKIPQDPGAKDYGRAVELA